MHLRKDNEIDEAIWLSLPLTNNNTYIVSKSFS